MTMICQICGTRSTLLVGPCIECAAAALPPPAVDIPTDELMLPAEFTVTANSAGVGIPPETAPDRALSAGGTTPLQPAPEPADTLPGIMVLRRGDAGALQSDGGTDHMGDFAPNASGAFDPMAITVHDEVSSSATLARQPWSFSKWRVPVALAAIALCAALAFIFGAGRPTSDSAALTEAASPGPASPVAAGDLPTLSATSRGETSRPLGLASDALSAASAASGADGKAATVVPAKKAKEQSARKSVLAHASPSSANADAPSPDHMQDVSPSSSVHAEPVPSAAADSSGGDPRQACSGGNFFSRAVCMNNRCAQAAYSGHDECVRLRKLAEDAESASLRGG